MSNTEPTTPPTPPEPKTPPAPAQEETIDWKAKFEEVQAQARKHEDRAKANANAAKELETLRQSTMTETEKAVNMAKLEARTEVLREVGGKLAEAQVRVAAAGRNVDVDALIDGIDASKFLDANGDPDTKAIGAWVDKVAPADASGIPQRRDLGLGARGAQQSAETPASAFGKFIDDALKT